MKRFFIFLAAALAFSGVAAQEKSLKQLQQEFVDLKFGMFIHFNIPTFMHQDWADPDASPEIFNPVKLDCQQWAKAARSANMSYGCLTTKHHSGFCIWDTQTTDYNVMNSPFGRDVVSQYADAFRKEGLKVMLYYSILDTHHDIRPGHIKPREHTEMIKAQLTELLTHYGKIGAIWFDGWWDQDINPDFDWQLPEQYALIHRLQPACMIGNNHHQVPFEGEDFQMFERDLPGENKSGLSGQDISKLPLETCETMNGMWGYKITDQDYKSTKTLIHYLVKSAGKNANLLMNIGPQPDGELPAVALQRLAEMGEWMKTYGETIYGTRAGIVAPHDWGVSTQKGNRLFVHVLKLQDQSLFLPLGNRKVKKVFDFVSKKPLKMQKCNGGIILDLGAIPTEIDKVVEIQL